MEMKLVEKLIIEVETLGIKANKSKLHEFEVLVIGSLDMADWNLIRVERALIPYDKLKYGIRLILFIWRVVTYIYRKINKRRLKELSNPNL